MRKLPRFWKGRTPRRDARCRHLGMIVLHKVVVACSVMFSPPRGTGFARVRQRKIGREVTVWQCFHGSIVKRNLFFEGAVFGTGDHPKFSYHSYQGKALLTRLLPQSPFPSSAKKQNADPRGVSC